jgi:hypothetical protein
MSPLKITDVGVGRTFFCGGSAEWPGLLSRFLLMAFFAGCAGTGVGFLTLLPWPQLGILL